MAASAPSSARSESTPHSRVEYGTAAVLFLFLNCLFLLTSTGRVHTIDEVSTVVQSESLLLRHNTAIPQAVKAGIHYGKYDRGGQPHSPYPPGQALLVVPWYAVGYYGLAKLPGVPPDIFDLVASATATFSNATFSSLAACAAFLLFVGLGLRQMDALLCSLLVALATPLFVYSGSLFSEPLSAAIFLAAAFLLFGLPSGTPISTTRIVAAGVLAGFSLHVRPTNLVTALTFLIALLVRGKKTWRPLAIFGLLLAIAGAVYLARNQALYGNFLDFGYPATAENGKNLNTFHTPFYVGLAGLLFSPGKSAFLFCPTIILGILGLPRLWNRNRGLAAVCALTPLLNLAFFCSYTQWEGSYCYGPRYLVPSLMLLGLPIAVFFLDRPRWFGKAFAAVFALGLFIQAIGLSTNMMEDMIRNHYYVGDWVYRMGYSPITGQLRLIFKYLQAKPAKLGLGFDRWFLFLAAAGVPRWIVACLTTPILASTLLSGILLRRLCKGTEREYAAESQVTNS